MARQMGRPSRLSTREDVRDMMGAEGQVTLSMKADNGGEVVMDSFVDMRLGSLAR